MNQREDPIPRQLDIIPISTIRMDTVVILGVLEAITRKLGMTQREVDAGVAKITKMIVESGFRMGE